VKIQHQITAFIINEVSLFSRSEIIYVNVSKTTDVFIAIVLRCSRWNLLIFLCYLCNVFFIFTCKKREENTKTPFRNLGLKRDKNI